MSKEGGIEGGRIEFLNNGTSSSSFQIFLVQTDEQHVERNLTRGEMREIIERLNSHEAATVPRAIPVNPGNDRCN